jgi:hypothetical protein
MSKGKTGARTQARLLVVITVDLAHTSGEAVEPIAHFSGGRRISFR